MWRSYLAAKSDPLALEVCAAHAGMALACSYSSSDEYEADVIQARRAAGAYGSSWPRRQTLTVLAALGFVAAVGALMLS